MTIYQAEGFQAIIGIWLGVALILAVVATRTAAVSDIEDRGFLSIVMTLISIWALVSFVGFIKMSTVLRTLMEVK